MSINQSNLSVEQTLSMVNEMLALDRAATTWRDNPVWRYKTISLFEITQDIEMISTCPEYVQLHHDVWIAYEWNYHRTARIILHEHILLCLGRLESICAVGQEILLNDLRSLRQGSTTIVQGLVDEVLSTVPQSLGDIDHEGNIVDKSRIPKCRGVGGYFLLWPIKISKNTHSATERQRCAAQRVFERIRECTGMKSALGDLSSI